MSYVWDAGEHGTWSPDGPADLTGAEVQAHNLAVEREELARFVDGHPCFFYLDGIAEILAPSAGPTRPQFVTTFLGTAVLAITSYREWHAFTPTGGQYERCSFTGRDLMGRVWNGMGAGPGMYCRIRLAAKRN